MQRDNGMSRYKTVKDLLPEEAAYIAGLLDGEGTITLSKRHKNENRQLVVSISNNERNILEYILEKTGVGSISKKRTYQEHHITNHIYKVSNRQAISLLEQIQKYLHSYKQKRAKIILEKYLELTPRNGKYTDELVRKRERFIERFFKIKPK